MTGMVGPVADQLNLDPGAFMKRAGGMTRRRWVGVALILGAVGLVGGLILRVWSDPWPPRLVIRLPEPSFGWGFSPDSRWLETSAAASDKGQELSSWDLATGKIRRTPPELLICQRSYVADGRSYVGASPGGEYPSEVVWVDVATGSIRACFAPAPLVPRFPRLVNDDRSIRAFLSADGVIREVVTWEIAAGTATRRPFLGPVGANGEMQPQLATPDGRILVYYDWASDAFQLWDAEAGRPIGGLLQTPMTRTSRPRWPGIKLTPDGKTLVIARHNGQTEVWDVASARLVRRVATPWDGFYTLNTAITPDGRILAMGGTGPSPPSILTSAWSLVGNLFPALRDEGIREVVVVDLITGRRLARLLGADEPLISPDGRTLVTQERDESYSVRTIPRLDAR